MDFQIRKELDDILQLLLAKERNGNLLEEYRLLKIKYEKIPERLELLFSILLLDGYVVDMGAINAPTWYSLTPAGRRFTTLSGYVSEGNKDLRRRLWEIIKIVAAVINAMILIYLAYLSTLNR